MKIVVSRNEIQAALMFASNDESRYTLNGVLLENHANGSKPTLVATDGRRLAVIETSADQPEDEPGEDRSLLLSREFLRPVCALSRALGKKLMAWIEISNKAGSKQVQVAFVGCKAFLDVEEGALIEGEYPKWRSIIPAKKMMREPINDLGLNADFIGDFASAGRMMGAETPIVQMNLIGKERAIEIKVHGLSNFYGLIMPCKADESLDYQPEFLAVTKCFPEKEGESATENTKKDKAAEAATKKEKD